MPDSPHQRALEALLSGRVVSDDALLASHSVDWGGENDCMPSLLVRPETTEELSVLLAYCHEHRQPIAVQGGLTGLSGGATPQQGEIAVSLEKMNGIIELDQSSMTLTAWAGTPLQVIQQTAKEVDMQFPLDLGARGSCTIGGNVSTNAGGNQVLNYGMTRALVLGIEAVLADGTVVSHLNKMLKNNAGYDLKQLFIGSEGTLGIVTKVVLRVFPAARSRQTAFCAFNSFSSAVSFLRTMQQRLPSVTAFELMWDNYISAVLPLCEELNFPLRERYPYYVLIESEGGDPERDRRGFEKALSDELEAEALRDAVVAQSLTEIESLWAIRDAVSEMLTVVKHRANFDIGVPISRMEEFVAEVKQTLNGQFANLHMPTFGHVADSNIHIIAWTDNPDDVEPIYLEVYKMIQRYNGTITAEHGIGVMKSKYLNYCRSSDEIALMQTLKAALDPHNILNPGRVAGIRAD